MTRRSLVACPTGSNMCIADMQPSGLWSEFNDPQQPLGIRSTQDCIALELDTLISTGIPSRTAH